MRVEKREVESFTIFDAPGLDPVTVTLHDYDIGKGMLTVAVFGQAWCHYWNAMGNRRVREFVATRSPDYLADKLTTECGESTTAYIERIAKAVIAALKGDSPAEGVRSDG